jgi:hypothetical protein
MKTLPINADCDRTFLPAYHFSGHRDLEDIWWMVLHDEEAPTAESAARWFRQLNSGGSTQLCVDDLKCFRTLPNDVIPWGARSAPQIMANLHGFHIEQAGYAKWTGTVWRRKHMRTLNRAAYKTAFHLKKFDLPVQFVTAAELPHKHGVTTHAEITKASKRLDPKNAWKYDHTDPGFGWPRWLFMRRVRTYYAELEATPGI